MTVFLLTSKTAQMLPGSGYDFGPDGILTRGGEPVPLTVTGRYRVGLANGDIVEVSPEVLVKAARIRAPRPPSPGALWLEEGWWIEPDGTVVQSVGPERWVTRSAVPADVAAEFGKRWLAGPAPEYADDHPLLSAHSGRYGFGEGGGVFSVERDCWLTGGKAAADNSVFSLRDNTGAVRTVTRLAVRCALACTGRGAPPDGRLIGPAAPQWAVTPSGFCKMRGDGWRFPNWIPSMPVRAAGFGIGGGS